jgi:hypothetical protein
MKNLIIGLLLLGGCVAIVDSVATDDSTEIATTTTAVIQTTVPARAPGASELPVVNPESESGNVKVAQSLINTLGGSISVTGNWRSGTTKAVKNLRNELNLPEVNTIDDDVWAAAIETINLQVTNGEFGKTTIRSLQNVKLPSGLLLVSVDEQDKSSIEWKYASPKGIEISDLAEQVFTLNPEETIAGWRFCESEGKTTYAQQRRFWWALPERMLSLVVNSADGVNNVVITEEQSVSLEGCAGYKTKSTTTMKAKSGTSAGASSGNGSNAECFVGMNLEDCEDLLGLFAGERTDYVDCTGEGRMVMWARNWTIIGAYKGVPLISKSPYGCA